MAIIIVGCNAVDDVLYNVKFLLEKTAICKGFLLCSVLKSMLNGPENAFKEIEIHSILF